MFFKCIFGIEIAIGIGIEHIRIIVVFDFDSDPDSDPDGFFPAWNPLKLMALARTSR
jgi:hypothetical protein